MKDHKVTTMEVLGDYALVAILIMIGAALFLAGCSTPTVTKVQTVEVKVPVAVQPIALADVPALPDPLPKRTGNLSADADTLLAKVCDLVGYMRLADPLLMISAGEKPRSLPPFAECGKH